MRRRAISWALATLALSALGFGVVPAMASAAENGKISGTVTKASNGEPIEGAAVCARGAENEICESTTGSGEYTISVPVGRYIVGFGADFGGLNYITQYWQESEEEFNLKVKLVEIKESGEAVSGIDAAMKVGGKIAGTVKNEQGEGIDGELKGEELEVCAIEELGPKEGRYANCALTNKSGEYTIAGLRSGQYKIEFFPGFEGLNYITQYYEDKATFEEGKAVSVEVEKTTEPIDAEMHKGGVIKGTVTAADSGGALEGIVVCALEKSHEIEVRCAVTKGGGTYAITGVPEGEYKIKFFVESGEGNREENPYLAQYYNDQSTFAEAESLNVGPSHAAEGIDAQLARTSTLWPANLGAPALSGTPNPGETLFCSTGQWSNNPTSYSYAWLRDGAAVAELGGSTYTVQSSDVGDSISCQVTAKNEFGSRTATSNIVRIATPSPAPVPTPVVNKPPKCKKGFKKQRVHGKARCVKVKKHKKRAAKQN